MTTDARTGGYARPLAAAMLWACAMTAAAQSSQDIADKTKPQIAALQAETANRNPAQQKMSSHLLDALKASSTGAVSANAPMMKAGPLTRTDEGVLIDINAKVSDDLLGEIARLGGKVKSQHAEFDAVRASMPLESIEQLAAREDVRQILPAVRARKNAIAAVEGRIAHGVEGFQKDIAAFGEGIRVGVLSDSIDDGYGALRNAIDRGTIDAALLSTLPEQEGEGEGEGLAMAEIVHALAPKAQIVFATGYGGPAQMAANILALADQGCQVIVDDLTYYNESPFQDGPISIAVRRVTARGVLYFSSARNSGNKPLGTSGTWEGDFSDGGPALGGLQGPGAPGRLHVFDQAKRATLNTVDKATQADRVDLFWSDPLGASRSQYNLFVVNNKGQVVRSSTTTQSGTQDPYQSVEGIRPGESIVIVKAGDAQARFLHLDTGRAVLRFGTGGNVRGHNASVADLAFSVAAIRVPSPLASFSGQGKYVVEQFSSDGPRRMFYESDGTPITPGNLSASGGRVYQKPDIAAANGVTTSLPAGGGLNPFFGTSAAAPHAAGIAAVLLSCSTRPSPQQVKAALLRSTIPIGAPQPSDVSGYGIVMASDVAVPPLCRQQLAAE